jgi:hypothetical protein
MFLSFRDFEERWLDARSCQLLKRKTYDEMKTMKNHEINRWII